MKKFFIICFAFVLAFTITGCNSNNNSKKENSKTNPKHSIETTLTDNQYKKVSDNIYQRIFDGDNYFYIELDDKTITYNNEINDYQVKYNVTDNTADMYGCRYHFDDNTTTDDGEGFGGCNDETINQIKEGKNKIDEEIKNLNINYSDIK